MRYPDVGGRFNQDIYNENATMHRTTLVCDVMLSFLPQYMKLYHREPVHFVLCCTVVALALSAKRNCRDKTRQGAISLNGRTSVRTSDMAVCHVTESWKTQPYKVHTRFCSKKYFYVCANCDLDFNNTSIVPKVHKHYTYTVAMLQWNNLFNS